MDCSVFTQQWEGKDKEKKNLFNLVQAGVSSAPVRVKRLPNSGRGKISTRAEESQSRLLMLALSPTSR